MRANLKILGYFLLIIGLCAVPYFHREIKKAVPLVQAESENARELYTGKTRAVYNPLDTAYIVTDTLKELIKKEEEQNFSKDSEWTTVSVWVDPKDLYDESRGILANPSKTGRIWERASYFNFYEKGEKKFSSFAGIRIHGGSSRLKSKRPTLRFNFRKSIGEDSFPLEGITLKGSTLTSPL